MPFNKTKMNLLKVSLFLFVGLTIVFAGFLFLRQGIFAQEPGEVIDQTGANHGTARNGADTTPDGKFKRGGEFDGIDDYVDCGNDESLNITDEITIEAWVKKEEFARIESILSKGPYSLKIGSDNKPYIELIADSETITDVGRLGSNIFVDSLAVYDGKLYAGTDDLGKVYRYEGGSTWTDVGRLGTNTQVNSLAVYDGKLYGGTMNSGRVYRYDGGSTWTDVGRLGTNTQVYGLAVYDGKLYGGTRDSGRVYRYDGGTTWTDVGRLGSNTNVISLAVYDGKLYGGTYDSGRVYRYDGGTTWTDVGRLGSNTKVFSLAVYDGKLYGGTYDSGRVYRYDGGTTWTDVGRLGSNTYVISLAVYDGKLYCGTGNSGRVYSIGQGTTAYSDTAVSTQYVHICGVYDGSTTKIYVNGNQEGSDSAAITIDIEDFPLLIGASAGSSQGGYSGSGEDYFKGAIDEVRIYNRALSSDEVLIIYNNYMEKMGSYYNVRKYVSPEPIFSGVGIEEGAPPAFCQSHNVKGWALPENIGWISFSCENETAIGEGVDYGVDIDETTGKFSGYAWSENIGWISFADFDGDGDIDADDENIAGSPCAPNCEAVLDLENGEVLGWARVLLTGEWIKLRGTAQDGTDYGLYVSENEFHNWAYGNELTGWISFNCAEGGYNEGSEEHYSVCEDSDYKVITDITINAPPFIENLGFDGDSDYCSIQAQGQIGIKWTFRDLDGDSQSEYHLQIATDSGFNNLVVDSIETQVIPESGTGTTNVVVKISPVLARDIGYAETYYWRMKVKDNEKWSKWEQYPDPFSTPSHPYPYVRFVWTPESPSADETVQLCSTYEDGVCGTDESVCYNNSFETCSCSGNLFEWTIPDAVFINPTDTSENPETQFSAPGDHSVKIRITDDVGSCYKEKIINSKLPLPGWKEITPFE